MKTCKRCQELLPLSAFDKMKTCRDGLAPTCKACYLAHRTPNAVCRTCDKPFYAHKKTRDSSSLREYCSPDCWHDRNGPRIRRTTCAFCGGPITGKPSKISKDQKYCSRPCLWKARRAHTAARTEKRCSRCGIIKALNEFWFARDTPDGHTYQCRDCSHKAKQEEYAENREKILQQQRDRRMAKRMAFYERDGGKCHICGRFVSKYDFTLDHIDPKSKGGLNNPENLAIAHFSCNSRRHEGKLPAQRRLFG